MLAAQVGKHHFPIALSALKSLYLSSHLSYLSAAYRNIAQPGGGKGLLLCYVTLKCYL